MEETEKTVPLYWMKQSGRMKIIVTKFLKGQPVTDQELKILKEYLQQWLAAGFIIPMNERVQLKDEINRALNTSHLREISNKLLEFYGIDPW